MVTSLQLKAEIDFYPLIILLDPHLTDRVYPRIPPLTMDHLPRAIVPGREKKWKVQTMCGFRRTSTSQRAPPRLKLNADVK